MRRTSRDRRGLCGRLEHGRQARRERHDYPAQLSRLLGSGYSVYAKGVGGRTMHSKADEPYEDEEEYDDAREIVEDADVAIVVSIFGTNDAKAVNWDVVKDDWVDEYKKFIEVFEALGATVIIGIPVPYLGNDVLLGNYVDMWAEDRRVSHQQRHAGDDPYHSR